MKNDTSDKAGKQENMVTVEELCVSKLINIARCPFCGELPNIQRVLDDSYFIGELNWRIQCKSAGCLFTESHPDRSLNNLLNGWNIRKEPTNG